MTLRREKREFTDEFKEQMVKLFNSGKLRSEIAREYDLTPSALNNWIRRMLQVLQNNVIIVRRKEQNYCGFEKKIKN